MSCRVPRPATPGSSPPAGLRAGERHAGELVAAGARSTSCPGEQIRFPTLERVTDEEFTLLSRASYNSPRGIWSDGAVRLTVRSCSQAHGVFGGRGVNC